MASFGHFPPFPELGHCRLCASKAGMSASWAKVAYKGENCSPQAFSLFPPEAPRGSKPPRRWKKISKSSPIFCSCVCGGEQDTPTARLCRGVQLCGCGLVCEQERRTLGFKAFGWALG